MDPHPLMRIARIAVACLTAALVVSVPSSGAARAALPPAPATAQARAPGSVPKRLTPDRASGIAMVRGSIRGHTFRDFVLHAGAGQALTVSLEVGNPSAYFNLLPPGSSDVAMFIGSTRGNRFQGVAPIAGDYTVRVYLMRSAARRNEASSFTLSARITGTAFVPVSSALDAVIPGTPFHAAATVRCALPYQPDVHECQARVIRYDQTGTATVELRGPNHFVRRILLVKGEPIASDATDPPTSTRNGDTTRVTIGAVERYELPDALIAGG